MSESQPGLVILAIDGATPQIMGPLLSEGYLPNLREMMGEDALRPLQSTVPAVTPCAWSTIFTGARPTEHGIWDFLRFDPERGEIELTTPAELPRMLTVWEALSAGERSVGLFNVPWTQAYPGIEGYVIPGFGTSELTERVVHPPELLAEITEACGTYPIAPQDEWYRLDTDEAVATIRRRIAQKVDIAAHLICTHPTDVMALGVMEVDAAGHTSGFWPPDMDDTALIAESPFGRVYRGLDEALGRLREVIDEDTPIVLLSDHGQARTTRRIDLLGLLEGIGAFGITHPLGLPPGLYSLLVKAVKPLLKLSGIRTRGQLPEALQRTDRSLRPRFEWDRCRAMPWGTGEAGFITLHPDLTAAEQEQLRGKLRAALDEAGLEYEEPAEEGRGPRDPHFIVHPPDMAATFRTATGRWGQVMQREAVEGVVGHAPAGVLMVSEGPWRERWADVEHIADFASAVAATVAPGLQWRPQPREGASEQRHYSEEEEQIVSDRLKRLGYL